MRVSCSGNFRIGRHSGVAYHWRKSRQASGYHIPDVCPLAFGIFPKQKVPPDIRIRWHLLYLYDLVPVWREAEGDGKNDAPAGQDADVVSTVDRGLTKGVECIGIGGAIGRDSRCGVNTAGWGDAGNGV